jgi:hypothetical protein
MNGGKITLTTAEQRRLIVLNHLEVGALVNAETPRAARESTPATRGFEDLWGRPLGKFDL